MLDVLAVTSPARAACYARRGFDSVLAPVGYHPVYGADLGLTRDIAMAFLGNVNAPRRRRLLPPLLAEMQRAGVRVVVQQHLYGAERTHFLNRCQILRNVLRAPHDYVGQRFLLAAANKVLVVTESSAKVEPFVTGRHRVSARGISLPGRHRPSRATGRSRAPLCHPTVEQRSNGRQIAGARPPGMAGQPAFRNEALI